MVGFTTNPEFRIPVDLIKDSILSICLYSAIGIMAFEKIDSNEKAYWLGLIISDGAITNQSDKGKFQLEITLIRCYKKSFFNMQKW